ncbi:MAG TPA: hypothetical protein VIV66_06060, partial [Pyrinomonadaceae bacterium]
MSSISATIIVIAAVTFSSGAAQAQTTAFTYQGRLTDNGAAANGNYDLQFTLWDALSGGTQQPQPAPTTVKRASVPVANGVFSVLLDFGVSAFPGADRFLEVGVRPASNNPNDPFTILAPRQQISSAPYALRTLSATAADSLSNACVACVQDSQINSVSGSKITGTIPTASVPPDSASYIQNGSTQQTNSNFNISGDGVIGGDLTVTGRINANISGNFIQNATALQNNANFNISGNGIFGGNVGVGTIAPQSKLHILGNAGLFTPFRGLTINQTINPGTNLNGYAMAVTTSMNGVTGTNFLIDSVGNVGVGTASPGYRLEVLTPPRSYGFVHSTIGNILQGVRPISLGSFAGAGSSGVSGGWLGTLSPDPLHFFVNNGAPSLTINTNGNVGIGTTNPLSKLQVVATANAITASTVNATGVESTATGNGFGVSGASFGTGAGVIGSSFGGNGTGVRGLNVNGTAVSGDSVSGIGVRGSSLISYAMYADGNAGQSRDKGGWVKAMALVKVLKIGAGSATITRCYNAITGANNNGCGFSAASD